MVRRCSGWREPIESEDASDALAVAICHADARSHQPPAGVSEGNE